MPRKTAVMESGKPFRPSTTAISTSSTPRFFSSFITRSQNVGLAPLSRTLLRGGSR